MLTTEQKKQLNIIISDSLDDAERHWKNGGYLLQKSAQDGRMFESINSSVESYIPGHEFVNGNVTTIDEFIALVLDMRDSSKHLMSHISAKVSKITMLQRVYYETSALLPAMAFIISCEGGSVTEYLGDGLLALFKVNSESPKDSIYSSHRAAKQCLSTGLTAVNDALERRYALPPIQIGIGMGQSKALVTLIGLYPQKQAKAFGECVFRATKLSNGIDQIAIDKTLKGKWPSSKGGSLRFLPKKVKGETQGYIISNN